MGSCLRCLRRFRSFVLLFFPPLLLLPLPLMIKTKEAKCGYIILLMAVYWCTEVIPLAVTALIPIVLFPMFGIMESQKVCMQYLKDSNMLFVGGLIVAVAVQHWNLHKRISLRVLLLLGVKPALLMLGFMGVTAFLSMWMSNTATTAMMIPIVQAVLDQLKEAEKDLGPTEETIAQVYSVYSVYSSVDVEPKSVKSELKSATDLEAGKAVRNGHIATAAKQPDDSEEMTRLCKGMALSVCYAASIGGTATLTGTGPNLVLKGQMDLLFPENGDVVNFASWFALAFPNMLLMLTLSWIWLQFAFMGFDFQRTWGRWSHSTEKEKVAYNMIKEEHTKLGPISFAEVNVLILFTLLVILWFTREPGFMPGWGTLLFNTAQVKYVTDATTALFVAFLLFVVPANKPKCCVPRNKAGGKPEPFCSPALLNWEIVRLHLPWSVVLLLGGGFALAKGSEESGLSKWLGEQMMSLQGLPPWSIAILISIVIAGFTEFASNVATATLFLPMFAAMAVSLQINPLFFMIPCTLSASFAFMLPVATPPNAIVFSYGHLQVADMAKTGIMMNIIGVLCSALAIMTWGREIFNLNKFPSWANTTNRK